MCDNSIDLNGNHEPGTYEDYISSLYKEQGLEGLERELKDGIWEIDSENERITCDENR